MRLLLDEMLPPGAARALRARGHDAVAVAGSRRLRKRPDRTILDAAREEDRTIVTADIGDFRQLAAAEAAAGRPFPPLILLPARSWPYFNPRVSARLVTALDALLASGAEVEGEHWLQPPD